MKTRLNDLFDQMGDEEGNKLDDKIEVEEDKNVEKLIKNIESIDIEEIDEGMKLNKIFNHFEAIDSNSYSNKTITALSLNITNEMLNKIKTNESIGMYLSYLIEKSPHKNHKLFLNNLKTRMFGIGVMNKKNVEVFGDVGGGLGGYMESGKIRVYGNADNLIGYEMEGGTIIIEGNTGNDIGTNMKNGDIYINGDIDDHILVKDKYLIILPATRRISHSHNYGNGNIYHKGKKIVSNGEIQD